MASIRKRGDQYFLDYRENGKRVRRVVGKNREEAEAVLSALKTTKPRSLKQLFEQFLSFIHTNRSTATVKRYETIISNFLIFINSNKYSLISSITSEVIRAFVQSRQEQNIKPRTINAELTVLRFVFRMAVQWGYMDANPLATVKNIPVSYEGQIRFLNKDEVHKLLSCCDEHLYPIIYTFLVTGLRKSELEDLRWTQIDFEARLIRLRKRSIPINETLNQLLQEQLYRSKGSLFVFPHTNGGKLPASRLGQNLTSLIYRAGIEKCTLSILRHTAVAHWMIQGASIQTIKETLDYSITNALLIDQQLKNKGVDDIIEGVHF